MSARTPFMPQRPNSRAHSAQSDNNASSGPKALPDTFRSNGLRSETPIQEDTITTQLKPNGTPLTGSPTSMLKTMINKPLNISAFVTNNPPHQSGHATGRPRRSLENGNTHSRSPKLVPPPNQHVSRLHGARPASPFVTNLSGYGPMNVFRGPSLPASDFYPMAPADERNTNEAHIVNSSVASSVHVNHGSHFPLDEDQPSANFPFSSSATHNRARMNRPSLERIQESPQGTESRNGNAGHNPAVDKLPEFDTDARPGQNDESAIDSAMQNSGKQVHSIDEDEEFNYARDAKRYKPDMLTHGFGTPFSRHSSPSSQYLDSDHPHKRLYASTPSYAPIPAIPAQLLNEGQGRHDHALQRLLGYELDTFVDSHAELYEESKKKWEECSLDEWRAGAELMATNFTKIIDFVKDHMTSKLALYSSLHSAVAGHHAILTDRDRTLQEARESLLREGGNVVSGRNADSAGQREG